MSVTSSLKKNSTPLSIAFSANATQYWNGIAIPAVLQYRAALTSFEILGSIS